jgi:hypothetical protein
MKNAAMIGKLAALGVLMGAAAGVSATSAQAARNVMTFSPYDPAFANAGDPAYAPRAQALERNGNQARSKAPSYIAPASGGPNLPYTDRPYGDPDRW